MDAHSPQHEHLNNLRNWRDPAGRDLTLANFAKHINKTHVRPAKQLKPVVDLWNQHIPDPIRSKTTLAAFTRGILTIHADDSATLYQLDRLLRSGLETQLRTSCKTTLRSVRLKLKPNANPSNP